MTSAIEKRIDEKVIATICGAVRAGCSIRTAARAGKRDRTTVYKWLARGRDDRAAGADSIYTQFLDEFEHAESEMLAEVEANVIAQSKRDWKAAAFVLKHRDPTTYNREGASEVAAEVAEALLHRIRERCRPETFEDVVTNALSDVIEVKP